MSAESMGATGREAMTFTWNEAVFLPFFSAWCMDQAYLLLCNSMISACRAMAWQSCQRSTPGFLGCEYLLASLPWPQLWTCKGCCNPKEETGRATGVPSAGAAQRDPVCSASAGVRATPLPTFVRSHGWLRKQVVTTACLTPCVLVLTCRGGSLGGRIPALLVLSLLLTSLVLTQIHYSITNP